MTDQTATPPSSAPLAAGLPAVQGRCPACGTADLFLGDGGYVTCSLIGCPEPDAASTLLERRPTEAAGDRIALRDRIAAALHQDQTPPPVVPWTDELPLDREYFLRRADAVLAVLPAPADQTAHEPGDEGDELVCVDQCGSCDACGMEPFGTPAEGWRQAARFLRRTARESGDRAGALHGARLIEAELRRLADETPAAEASAAPQCTAGLLPATSGPVDRCVRHGKHDSHVSASGARWGNGSDDVEQPAAGARPTHTNTTTEENR